MLKAILRLKFKRYGFIGRFVYVIYKVAVMGCNSLVRFISILRLKFERYVIRDIFVV